MTTFSRSSRLSGTSRSVLSLLPAIAAHSLFALALTAATAGGQSAVPLPLASLADGARVRITLAHGTAAVPNNGPLVGRLQSATPDSLTFVGKGSTPMTLSMLQVARLDASQGTRRLGKRGMGLGFAIGAVGGAFLGYGSGGNFIFSAADAAAITGAMLGAVGALAGGLIGHSITTDVWRPVAVGVRENRLSLRPMLSPSQSGLHVRVSW